MSRGRKKTVDTVEGALAWAYMRRHPDYRAAWAAHAVAPRFEDCAHFRCGCRRRPIWRQRRRRTGTCWPGRTRKPEAWRSPFWSGVPMLVGEPDTRTPYPDPTPLLGLLAEAGARVEGLRLASGRVRAQGRAGQWGIADPGAVGAPVRSRGRDHGEARAEPAAGDGGHAHRRLVGGLGWTGPLGQGRVRGANTRSC